MLTERPHPNGLAVVKIGGIVLDDAGWVAALAESVSAAAARRRASEPAPADAPLLLVHGGGRSVSALQQRLGLEPEWRDGLRVTGDATLDVVAMVLSGLVNKRLVAALLGAGVRAAGVSGEDDGLLVAEPLAGGLLGRTGRVARVRPDLLHLMLGAGITPVVSPLSRGPDGRALNVNADDAAAALAAALGARRLLFVSDVAGVRLGGGVAGVVAAADIEPLVQAGEVTAGMAPKLRAAARAAAAGVADVRIGDLALLAEEAGTRVVARAERAA